jgi:hypothetical protein
MSTDTSLSISEGQFSSELAQCALPSQPPNTIDVVTTFEKKGKFDFIRMALLEVIVHMAPHPIITAGYTILSYFYGNGSVEPAGINTRDLTRISGPSTIQNK